MVYRYRTNLKKVFLTDSELHQLNERIAKSNCQNFSVYARRVLLNPNMSFVIINTDTYDRLVFELRRIGNNINQIAKHLNENKNNQTKELMSNYQNQLENLEEKIQEVVHYISEG